MKDRIPQPTAVLLRRLRRVAVKLDRFADARKQGDPLLPSVETLRAAANTCWQVAGRLDELDAAAREGTQP